MRWRDVRHGKISEKKKKEKPILLLIAPISSRVKAFIADTFMILMPLMYFVFYMVMSSREEFAANMLLGWVYIFAPHFLIIIAFWHFKAQTPGYKSQNIKLVTTNLQKPSIIQLIIRYFVFFVSSIVITGVILCFLRKDKKNLHDLLSGTMPIVIEE
jgi:uncharacterized RDD family membrane protein YckC